MNNNRVFFVFIFFTIKCFCSLGNNFPIPNLKQQDEYSNIEIIYKDANEPYLNNQFLGWFLLTYIDPENDKKYCYTFTEPIASVGNYKEKVDIKMILVVDEYYKINIYIYSKDNFFMNSNIEISIDGTPFTLVDMGNGIAATKNSIDDVKLLNLMLEGSTLLVYSRFFDGRYSVDSYSIRGLDYIYSSILSLCQRKN